MDTRQERARCGLGCSDTWRALPGAARNPHHGPAPRHREPTRLPITTKGRDIKLILWGSGNTQAVCDSSRRDPWQHDGRGLKTSVKGGHHLRAGISIALLSCWRLVPSSSYWGTAIAHDVVLGVLLLLGCRPLFAQVLHLSLHHTPPTG